MVDKYRDNKRIAKRFVIFSIVFNLGLLGFFKYYDFLVSILNSIGINIFSPLNISLPIGISFYTFQIISYVVDVYRGKVSVQKSFIRLATYVSLFPQLIAGPIVRYETIEEELKTRSHNFENFAEGARRFTIGLAKKVLIANILGELCTNFDSSSKSIIFYWLFSISYMLQIYFDFSAYSDMAIGLGRIFGFHFLENFNYPYISKSITEFWRRWHISLSSWFKDYVYIPLGGNRVGKIKLLRNILIVWLLTGFWHGASWNFIVWGLMFGIILIIEKLWFNKYLEKLPNILKRIYVLFIVMISFIIFRADNLSEAFKIINGLFGFNKDVFINEITIYNLKNYFVVILIAILAATPILKNLIIKLKKNKKANYLINLLEPFYIVFLLIIVTAYLIDNSYNPFLYFRF